jgi:hypothetical protein
MSVAYLPFNEGQGDVAPTHRCSKGLEDHLATQPRQYFYKTLFDGTFFGKKLLEKETFLVLSRFNTQEGNYRNKEALFQERKDAKSPLSTDAIGLPNGNRCRTECKLPR